MNTSSNKLSVKNDSSAWNNYIDSVFGANKDYLAWGPATAYRALWQALDDEKQLKLLFQSVWPKEHAYLANLSVGSSVKLPPLAYVLCKMAVSEKYPEQTKRMVEFLLKNSAKPIMTVKHINNGFETLGSIELNNHQFSNYFSKDPYFQECNQKRNLALSKLTYFCDKLHNANEKRKTTFILGKHDKNSLVSQLPIDLITVISSIFNEVTKNDYPFTLKI